MTLLQKDLNLNFMTISKFTKDYPEKRLEVGYITENLESGDGLTRVVIRKLNIKEILELSEELVFIKDILNL